MSRFKITVENGGPPRAGGLGVLALACLSALGLPSCGEDNPAGLPNVPRARIGVAVDPNPVVGSQSPLTLSVSAAFNVTVGERNGLGGELVFISATVFDPPSGGQVALNYFDAADLAVFVGTSRIEAGGTLELPITLSYTLPDLTKEADMTVAVQFRDDRGNLVNYSLLVKIV